MHHDEKLLVALIQNLLPVLFKNSACIGPIWVIDSELTHRCFSEYLCYFERLQCRILFEDKSCCLADDWMNYKEPAAKGLRWELWVHEKYSVIFWMMLARRCGIYKNQRSLFNGVDYRLCVYERTLYQPVRFCVNSFTCISLFVVPWFISIFVSWGFLSFCIF